MINSKHFNNGHICNYTFLLLENQKLDKKDREMIAEHLTHCIKCAGNYADFLMEDEGVSVPPNLEDNIFKYIHLNKKSHVQKKSLLPQFLKLGVAAVITISLYSSGFFNIFSHATYGFVTSANVLGQSEVIQNIEQYSRLDQKFYEFSNKVNNGFLLRGK